MSFGTKYNLTFKDHFQTQWDIDFQIDGYSGAITDLIGTADPVSINYEASDHFTHSPLKASSVEIRLIELTDDAYKDFFISDKTAKVKIYKGTDLFWQGWTLAEGYNSLYNLCPKPVTLTAIDGLSFLKSCPLSVSETGAGAIDETGIFAAFRFLKQAFDKIGFSCNIYESLNLYDYRVNQALSPFTETHLDTWKFYNGRNKDYSSLYNVLTDILTAWGARLYQKDGCWYIDHIRQLSSGSITYRAYNSSLTYTGTSVEDRTYDITSASGSPLNVPINHSLFKQLERPLSKLKLTSQYHLNKELLRYIDAPSVEGDITYEIQEDKFLKIHGVVGHNYSDGLIYNLGRMDFSGLTDPIMNISLRGEFYGSFSVSLYIYNEDDATNYYYYGLYDGNPTTDAWKTSSGYVLHAATTGNWRHIRAFDVSYDIYADEETFKGTMYLLICAPYNSFVSGIPPLDPQLILDLDDTTVTYNECRKQDKTFELINSSNQTNLKEIELNIYGEPKKERFITYGGITTEEILTFVNPHLVYPGIFYYYDGDEYLPCYAFKYGTDDEKKLENFIIEDIMTFYANLRLKITGTLLGQMNFGMVLDYDSKRYMIASSYYNLKKSQNEIVALQISEVGSFLLNEDDTYILLEDGNKITL